MLHPVGELPPAVYWRRRALLLGLLVALVVGGGWAVVSAVAGGTDTAAVAEDTGADSPVLPAPSLEQVVPSLAAGETPTAPAPTTTEPAPVEPAPAPETPAGPVYTEGQACGDDMIAVGVSADPAQAAVGSKPTFTLTVTNTSPVSCTRSLDAGLREIVLLDGAGTRLWGSQDCFPEASSEPRTLAAGEVLAYPLVWGGLTSSPGCATDRVTPAPGAYQLQARLDTAVGPAVPFSLV
ncbi:MucR family transcriptional regulator [Geodermatophilus sp. Leaf369]|uniref:hypothetical protein n=1 Tax=Geodermatophilus sp. Leaf369 TaxID=1736354 RepID=UPI0006F3BBA2|nr:hypothetical protein [Geodermatophilus sp. Leaf369]KQS60463.1 MucR family transcriptional regulator [Geodermatophilus sp. Leaf369]